MGLWKDLGGIYVIIMIMHGADTVTGVTGSCQGIMHCCQIHCYKFPPVKINLGIFQDFLRISLFFSFMYVFKQ